MRTRTRSQVPISTAVKRVKGYTSIAAYNSWGSGIQGAINRAAGYGTLGTVVQTLPLTEEISDEPRFEGKLKPCIHKRVKGSTTIVHTMQKWTDSTTQCYFSSGYVPKIPVPSSPPSWSSLDIVLQRMAARDALIPAFRAAVETASFIAELKDFRNLVSLFARAGDRISNLVSEVPKWIGVYKKGRVKYFDPTIGVANLQLTANLSVKPLVNDLCKIHDALGGMREHLAKFNAQGQLVNRHHYTGTQDSSWVLKSSSYENDSYRVEEYEKQFLTFHAAGDLTYRHVVDNDLDLFLQHYGLRLTPSVIWNLIPFSFVVDYFANVGKMMESMSKYGGTEFKVRNYQESISARTVRVKILSYNQTKPNGHPAVLTYYRSDGSIDIDDFVPPTGGIPIASASSTTYNRSPVMPFPEDGIGMALPRFKFPNLTQGCNLAALARVLSPKWR